MAISEDNQETSSSPTVSQHGRRPRSWWQYLVGVAMLGGAVYWAALIYVFPREPQLVTRLLEPRRITAPPGMDTATHVPAKHGDLAGCNVLLITMDTTRADRLGCYGNDQIATPALDRLATEGVLFTDAVTPAPTTLPSHASILTGLFPIRHGARANAYYRLDDAKLTLAEILQSNGYATGAVVSAIVLNSRYGLSQGFERYQDDLSEGRERPWLGGRELPADAAADRALAWLARQGHDKFFLWVHFFDPHAPYTPPQPFQDQYKDNPYDGEIAFVDEQIGRLLKHLDDSNIRERTLVVVAGDHGESLGEHDEWTHGILLYDSSLRVPFIMNCGSRLGGGVEVTPTVSTADIMPTVLSLLGLGVPEGLDGADLTQPMPEDRAIYCDTLEGLSQYGLAPLMGVFQGGMKYILGPTSELYDRTRDPFELDNIIEARLDTAKKMRNELEGLVGGDPVAAMFVAPTRQPDSAELEDLQALGYAAGGIHTDQPIEALPDPRKEVEWILKVQMTIAQHSTDGLPKTIERLRKIVDQRPDFNMAIRSLADAYWRSGDLTNAAEWYARCLEIDPGNVYPKIQLARIHAANHDYQDAIQLYKESLEARPDGVREMTELAAIYGFLGRYEDSLNMGLRVFDLLPSSPEIVENVAHLFVKLNRTDEALRLFEARLVENPHLEAVRNTLAGLYASRSEYVRAVELLREGLELNPESIPLANNLAILLTTTPSEAVFFPLEGVLMLEQACARTKYQMPELMYTLSVAYSAANRIDEGIVMATRAQKVALEQDKPELAQSIKIAMDQLEQARAQGVSPMRKTQPGWSDSESPAPTTQGSD